MTMNCLVMMMGVILTRQSLDTPRPRRRIWQKFKGDIAAGRGEVDVEPGPDQEAEERPSQNFQSEGSRAMEATNDEDEEGEGKDKDAEGSRG